MTEDLVDQFLGDFHRELGRVRLDEGLQDGGGLIDGLHPENAGNSDQISLVLVQQARVGHKNTCASRDIARQIVIHYKARTFPYQLI